MSPAVIIMAVVGIVWLGGGCLWLLSRRSYDLRQLPEFVVDLIGFPVEFAQSVWGRQGVPWPLLFPNLMIFGLFTFLPVLLSLYISLTTGQSIRIFERPWVGFDNYARIFNCANIFEPRTCGNEGYAFWAGMFNTLTYVVIQVPVLIVASLLTAMVVNRAMFGRGFWRAMFFYPVMLSPVVIANIWNWMLDRRGVLNAALDSTTETIGGIATHAYFDMTITIVLAVVLMASGTRIARAERDPSLSFVLIFLAAFLAVVFWANPLAMIWPDIGWLSLAAGLVLAGLLAWLIVRADKRVGLVIFLYSILSVALLLTIQFDSVFDFSGFRPVNWLVTPNTGWPMFWLVFVYTWSHMGFYMLILLAGLQAIPADIYEAAQMDGTRPFRIFSSITVPMVMPTIIVVLVLCLIRSFQVFDEPYLLTGGGPGRETRMIVQTIYETAFGTERPDYGIASAAAVLMALVIAAITAIQLLTTRRQSGL